MFELLAGCGASPTPVAHPPDHEDATEVQTAESETREVAAEPEPEPPTPLTCADRSAANCAEGDGCVAEQNQTCREAANACERVVPNTARYQGGAHPDFVGMYGRVTFASGDPCGTNDATCMYDYRARLCEPFTAVPACPDTMAEAAALQVSCAHPGQPALRCHYADNGGTTFECLRP